MTTAAERDRLVLKATQIASVGGSLLSNASTLRRWAGELVVDEAPPPPPPPDPDPTPPPPPDPDPSDVIGGWQVSPGNTGPYAFLDPGLGRLLLRSDLTASRAPRASDLTDPGGTISRAILDPAFEIDIDCTLLACLKTGALYSMSGATWSAQWCIADCTTASGWQNADTGVWGGQWSIFRTQVFGASDGLRGSGSQSCVESWVRTMCRAADAHSDAYQYYNPSAKTSEVTKILRSNLDANPVNGIGAPNAAFFAADSPSLGLFEVRDNRLRGGTYVIRCNDSGRYRVTGNRVQADGQYSAMRYGKAVIEEWADNVEVNAAGDIIAAIPQPH